jgi:putative exporter of polyketide antibiotics
MNNAATSNLAQDITSLGGRILFILGAVVALWLIAKAVWDLKNEKAKEASYKFGFAIGAVILAVGGIGMVVASAELANDAVVENTGGTSFDIGDAANSDSFGDLVE